jgi:hypothetical protein
MKSRLARIFGRHRGDADATRSSVNTAVNVPHCSQSTEGVTTPPPFPVAAEQFPELNVGHVDADGDQPTGTSQPPVAAVTTEPFQELNDAIVNADGDQPTDSITDQEFIEFRKKCRRFRVLVIGPRNSGKTTILERLTGDIIERAEFRSPEGNLVRVLAIGAKSWETSLTYSFRSMSKLKGV